MSGNSFQLRYDITFKVFEKIFKKCEYKPKKENSAKFYEKFWFGNQFEEVSDETQVQSLRT